MKYEVVETFATCPFCKHKHAFISQDKGEKRCESCKKIFNYEAIYEITAYRTYKNKEDCDHIHMQSFQKDHLYKYCPECQLVEYVGDKLPFT